MCVPIRTQASCLSSTLLCIYPTVINSILLRGIIPSAATHGVVKWTCASRSEPCRMVGAAANGAQWVAGQYDGSENVSPQDTCMVLLSLAMPTFETPTHIPHILSHSKVHHITEYRDAKELSYCCLKHYKRYCSSCLCLQVFRCLSTLDLVAFFNFFCSVLYVSELKMCTFRKIFYFLDFFLWTCFKSNPPSSKQKKAARSHFIAINFSMLLHEYFRFCKIEKILKRCE